jgi:hypothetical protein
MSVYVYCDVSVVQATSPFTAAIASKLGFRKMEEIRLEQGVIIGTTGRFDSNSVYVCHVNAPEYLQ